MQQFDTLVWLRRDLRLSDNAALYHALKAGAKVLPIFIFDTDILDKLPRKDARLQFIHDTLSLLKKDLEDMGSSLWVEHGKPTEIWQKIAAEHAFKAVYANHDYEPYAKTRDELVRNILSEKGIAFHTFKDQTIFEQSEILNLSDLPYTVFTPYSKKWKATLNDFYLKSYPTEKYFSRFAPNPPLPFPTYAELGFEPTDISIPQRLIPQSVIQNYHQTRDFPYLPNSTTRLGIHLRFGTLSIRKLAQIALKTNEKYLNELIWRDFYMQILWHFPHVTSGAFRKEYDRIAWENDEQKFRKWCEGKTGYPLVDAGMRELNATGYMHNRVRMVVASFLCKHLLIDWRWGEAYFAEKLLDFDLSANNGSWQWASGSGCDAAPYFRVFNPLLQLQKFDPQLVYVRKWVPEYGSPSYPRPMVDHATARQRAIEVYQAALKPGG